MNDNTKSFILMISLIVFLFSIFYFGYIEFRNDVNDRRMFCEFNNMILEPRRAINCWNESSQTMHNIEIINSEYVWVE